MWTSEAFALIAFSIRRLTRRTTGASNAMSRSEREILAPGVLPALVVPHGLDDLLDRRGAGAEVPLDRLDDRRLRGHRQAHVHPQRSAEVVDDRRIGRVGAGHHQDAVLDGKRAEAVLAHVLGRQALEERGSRGELVSPDVGDLEVAGQRLAHLFRAREAEPDERVGQMLTRGLTVRLGPRQLCVREEACTGQPSSERRGMAGIHGSSRIRVGNSVGYRRGGGAGKQCFP